jgi:1-phosphatidylinositol-3-phosphate 5-kinase
VDGCRPCLPSCHQVPPRCLMLHRGAGGRGPIGGRATARHQAVQAVQAGELRLLLLCPHCCRPAHRLVCSSACLRVCVSAHAAACCPPSALAAAMASSSRGSLHDTLYQLHATASRSSSLTTFDDLTAPPASLPTLEAARDPAHSGGLSGLYSRLRASVSAARDASREPSREAARDAARDALVDSPAWLSSPVLVSLPSSRIHSPSTAAFPDAPPPPSRDSTLSSATLSSKLSLNPSRSRPSILSPTIDQPKPHRDDDAFAYSPVSTHSRTHSTSTFDLPNNGSVKDLASASPVTRSPHFAPVRDDHLHKKRSHLDMEDHASDDTDDDLHVARSEALAAAASNNARDQSDSGPASTQLPHLTGSVRSTAPSEPQRPPLLKVGPSHLPGFLASSTPSSDGVSSIITTSTVRAPTTPPIAEIQRQALAKPAGSNMASSTFSQMRRRILDREFWMRDENARDCFNCGDAFTTFRRKHHCRTCGQIFDSKCTSIVSGKIFDQPSNLRVCKPCEAIIYGHDDDSSDYTDDGDQGSFHEHGDGSKGFEHEEFDLPESDHTKIGTPTISIPMSRKSGNEKKRRSHVIEVGTQTLARPSSSRSLRSLSGRPRSSSHKRHSSKPQLIRHSRHDDRAPFHHYLHDNNRSQSTLPAFHHDNIIDPDLAPFMSDDGSSEDEPTSLFATLENPAGAEALEGEKGGLGGLLAAMRKGKSRAGDRGGHARDADNMSVTSRHGVRPQKRRNLSVSSITHRPSPRRSKSNTLLRPFTSSFGAGGIASQQGSHPLRPSPSTPPTGTKVTRSASMQGGIFPKVELNNASLDHARKLLKQMLHDEGILHVSSWEKALIPILRQCTDDVNPDVDRGDDIDVRNYIKLKKIPGGRPRDTAYVSGVVFTKNVALRSMPRSIPNPRIIIITFPLEYTRHQGHFMSLEPVIAQEKEYLKNMVSRIAALRPHVLLVQRNVSGLALEYLEQEGIAVVYNVKPTVLNAVARCTQSRMISSIDKLTIDPSHLGHCGSFDVKTYVHKKVKKTYIYLSGCQKDLGCTIILRGAESSDLVRLKRVTEFMTYVVYNLRLETCLMRDEFVDTPTSSIVDPHALSQAVEEKPTLPEVTVPPTDDSDGEATEDHHSTDELPGGDAAPSYYSELVENHRTKILSSSPFVKFMQPYLLEQAREYERKLDHLKKLKDQYTTGDDDTDEEIEQKFELVQPEMVHVVVERASKPVRDFLSAVHASEYDKALHNYETQKRQWEAYLSGNTDLYNPFNHQKIAVLYSVVNTTTSTPCIGPEIIALGFYQEHDFDDGFTPDCTLGQYVEDLCTSAGIVCEVDGCNRRMLDHSRQYVHGEGQMSVIVQKHPPKLKGLYQAILMWSVCRLCGQETQPIPMSEWTWKYSFAKYLELTFWSTQLHPRADICPHDIHKDHVRYFGYNNVALRIQYDVVPMYEVIVPRPNVTWKVDSDLKLKNEQFLRIEERLDRFMASVRARIKSIHVESVIPEKIEACTAEVERLMKRANEEHEWLRNKLQNKYMISKYYEIIPLNRAIRAIQEKAIAWDDTFTDFEQTFFPSEKDIRRLATLQLKKLFLERDESTTSLTSVDEGTESGGEEPGYDEKDEPVTPMPLPSNMSPEKARDMLTSVVKEHRTPAETEADESAVQDDRPSTPVNTTSGAPVHSPRQAVEREDVRHLDLAISSNLPDNVPNPLSRPMTPSRSPESVQFDEGSPTPTAHPKINPIDKSLAEAIENMRTSPPPVPSSHATLESKIPRLVEIVRRDPPTRPALLTRTQSQPGNTSKQALPTFGSLALDSNIEAPRPIQGDSSKTLERMSERLRLGSFKQGKTVSRIPRSVPFKNQSKVSKLAHHFEQLSREFQKERTRERWRARDMQARAYPLASSKPIVEVYKDVHEAVQENDASDDDSHDDSPTRESMDNSTLDDRTFTETAGATPASQSPADERHVRDISGHHTDGEGSSQAPDNSPSDVENETSDVELAPEDIHLPDSISSSQLLSMSESQLESSLELPRHEKTTLLKMLTNFWSERSASGWVPLDYPFAQIEHVWEDSDIIVREDEPSSIIALALSSPDYLVKLQSFRDDPYASIKGGRDLETAEDSIERNLLHDKNTNIRYGFTNRGVRAQCKIFYAQSFDALRRKCGVADRFVESLSRCSKYESKGGKSKSIFLKTLDDRFILKSLSPIEVQAFFRFAPNYFAFTHQNLFRQLPSVIAKMFGLFQVQIKTPTGRDFDWFMLVMENLFYDREPNRRYDLKGSMRNRKIQSTGERDEVLLDENLVDIIYSETPIFVREHTKKLLKASVWNDTLFLSQNNVMDYSLMAGFDDTNREIIVGIIDCIRTYTWDKKLESWIKDRGKNKPTITSPKDYRNRFRIAMEKYILQAPNCWHQFAGRMVAGGDRRRMVLEGLGAESGGHHRVVSGGSGTGAGSVKGAQSMEFGGEIVREEARKIK